MAFKSRVSTGRRSEVNNDIARLKAQVAEIDKKAGAEFVRQAVNQSANVDPKKGWVSSGPVVITRPARPRVALLAFNKHIASELQSRLANRGELLKGSPEQEAIWQELADGDRHVMVNAVAGSGKCLGKGTPVLLWNGLIKPVEEITKGDELMGPDSEPRLVRSINKGIGRLYRIVPVKGDPWICNEDHILTLAGTNRFNGQLRDVSLMDYRTECRLKPSTKIGWKLVRTGCDWPDARVPISPYFVGLWMGDGTKTETHITTVDAEIVEYVRSFAECYGLTFRKSKDRRSEVLRISVGGELSWGIAKGRSIRDLMRRYFVRDGIKRIHHNYLTNSRGNRLMLLAGLLDSDGYYANGYYEIISKWPELAAQIQFLARSLGFAAYSSIKTVKITEDRFQDYVRVIISGENLHEIPCLLYRKQSRIRKQIKRTNVTGFKIEPLGVGEYFGFTLNGDGRFLLGDFTITHNTTVLIQACLRLDADTSAMTYHSLGMKAVGRAFGKLRVDEYKTWSILDGMKLPVGDHLEKVFKVKLVGMVGKAKNYGLLKPKREELEWIVDRHDLELDDMQEMVFDMVPDVLKKSAQQTSVIDFDDMIWLPYVLNLDTPKFDIVMSDEAQDLNMIQQYLALKAGARHVVVGDRNQAIYSFRGADSKSMDSMRQRLDVANDGRGVVDMPLTLTRRCPKSHVEMAQMLVPQIKAMDSAPQGKVTLMSKDEAVKVMRPGDMVLCRVNAELLMVAYKLLKRGVKAVVRGRDIGRGIVKLIEHAEKDAGQSLTVSELMTYAGNITDSEVSKFMSIPHGRGEMRASSARDKMDCLISISDGARNSGEVKQRIEQLFADFDSEGMPRHAVVLSTVHRGKGLEAGRVFILRGDLMPHPMAKKAEDMEQERNLAYVAVTRAKFNGDGDGEGELVWVGQQSELFGEVDAELDGEL